MEIFNACQVIAQLCFPHLYDQRRWVGIGVTVGLIFAGTGRGSELPGVGWGSAAFYIIGRHGKQARIVNQTSDVRYPTILGDVRAARVLDMLLVLQRSGRITANALAERLEVSQRTILRDVEALGEAGVPIFTTRGPTGGIELMHGFQTHLTGLTTDEAASLFLIGQPLIAHRLGLGAAARSAHNKLLNALPPALGNEANRLSTWFLNDPDPETGNHIPHGELRRIARSIHERREIELEVGTNRAIRVRPLGLVLKAGSWTLVVSGKARSEFICIDDLRSTRLTTQSFAAPVDFDLQHTWRVRPSKVVNKTPAKR